MQCDQRQKRIRRKQSVLTLLPGWSKRKRGYRQEKTSAFPWQERSSADACNTQKQDIRLCLEKTGLKIYLLITLVPLVARSRDRVFSLNQEGKENKLIHCKRPEELWRRGSLSWLTLEARKEDFNSIFAFYVLVALCKWFYIFLKNSSDPQNKRTCVCWEKHYKNTNEYLMKLCLCCIQI